MKLRGESGSLPARMGGVVTGLRGGKSTSTVVKKAVKTAKKTKPLAEPKSAVKVVSPMPRGMTKAKNDYAAAKLARTASGKSAKSIASSRAEGMKIAKDKARIAEIKELQRFLARGGKLLPKKLSASTFKNDVRVIKNK